MIESTKAMITQAVEEHIPAHKFFGLKIKTLEKGFVRVEVPFRNEVVGDIRKNRWHGGMIAAVIDAVGGIVGITYFDSPADKLSTIDLRIDYLKGAEAKELIIEGKMVRQGNRILVIKMKVFQEEALIAEGKGVFNFLKIEG